MNRSYFPWLLVLVALLVAVGFYRGWFAVTSQQDPGPKVDIKLTVDPDQMRKDAEQVKERVEKAID